MQFVDYVKINIRSGKGGNGCSSFRREKFIPRGGPDGGDGGDGGSVYFRGTRGKNTLLDFRFRQHYRAGDGVPGRGKDMHGRNGEDLIIEVPIGTVVRDPEADRVLLEVLDEEPQLCMDGGRGGRGNARFKTSTHRVPEEWEEGTPGDERWIVLELKLFADVGLVGFPNAGKSTLISAVSKAHPKIADYPFTTLVPNLGVVQTEGFESFVVADIPGIIEGAHEGTGLGLRFLRHIERTALLLLLVDCTQKPEAVLREHTVLLDEMRQYSPGLLEKPRAVALTKVDAAPDAEQVESLQAGLTERGERVFAISAVSGAGLPELLRFLAAQVAVLRAAEREASPSPRSAPASPHS
ncbi:MAG TPA: GTPase ObgE [bacterium]|nr:GTPase ObgE [bacterium]